MKVGVDAVLLGAWASIASKSQHILEVGSGCGLISLMIAQRFVKAKITAVEIDSASVEESRINFRNSAWSNRLEILETNFLDYEKRDSKKYGLIISNPPYFKVDAIGENKRRKRARQFTDLGITDLLSRAVNLLEDDGSICLIFPFDGVAEIKKSAGQLKLNTRRLVHVYGKAGDDIPKRVLIELCKGVGELEFSEMSIRENTLYSKSYIDLTKDFYLDKV